MRKIIYTTLCLLLLSFVKTNRVEQKTNKVLSKTFKEIDFEKTLIPIVAKNKDEKWYKVIDKTSKKSLGILETTSTKGKFDKFDFMVLYNMDKTINKVRVLIYREDHGGEIGSKRWLKQFNGKSIQDSKSLHHEVDGISGATISCNAITKEIKSSLIKVQKIN